MGAAGTVIGKRTVDEALHRVLPSVVTLLRQATGKEPLGVLRRDLGELKLSAPVTFPDNVGTGELVATVFAYRGQVRADLVLEHDRVLANQDGVRSRVRCFLNDFQASVTVPADADALPHAWVQRTLLGYKDAVAAVDRHRGRSQAAWGAIHVAKSGARIPSRAIHQHGAPLGFTSSAKSVATEWRDEDDDERESPEEMR